ncbi:hypothetical protein HY572_06440 [Candidatus Micrarchaeota archaeon]|nr:hypothetical protein [Candidatus Micrarchaeota archaeon]
MTSTESILQSVRACVAKELVLSKGLSRAKAAKVLGVTAPAVSQYVSGKRGGKLAVDIEHDKQNMAHVKKLADELLRASGKPGKNAATLLLKTAEKIQVSEIPKSPSSSLSYEGSRRKYLLLLRDRLEEEQHAASESMRFAQSCEDELIQTMFRQIASDSLRHADTVSVLIHHLEEPESFFDVKLPSKEAVDKMIQQEEAADEADLGPLKARLGPAARLLIESVEADERKHVLLLKGLQRVIEEQKA